MDNMTSNVMQPCKARMTCSAVGILVVIVEEIKLQPHNSCIVFMLACYIITTSKLVHEEICVRSEGLSNFICAFLLLV
jgi:hypothetical protein